MSMNRLYLVFIKKKKKKLYFVKGYKQLPNTHRQGWSQDSYKQLPNTHRQGQSQDSELGGLKYKKKLL